MPSHSSSRKVPSPLCSFTVLFQVIWVRFQLQWENLANRSLAPPSDPEAHKGAPVFPQIEKNEQDINERGDTEEPVDKRSSPDSPDSQSPKQHHSRFSKPISPELKQGTQRGAITRQETLILYFTSVAESKKKNIAKMMMPLLETETHIQKNSLFTAMNRFLGAVNNMDQTVMVPSLLRDVPLDEDRELSSMKSDMDEGDMYSYYQLLKSIRTDMEWGVRCATAEERQPETMKLSRMNSMTSTYSSASSSSSYEEDEEEEDEDLEKQFQYHLTGLQGVLSKLTQQANSLTKRYKKEIGIGGCGQ